MARQNLALIATLRGAYHEATRHLEASLAILTEMGDRHFANVATSALADIARLSGDRERARHPLPAGHAHLAGLRQPRRGRPLPGMPGVPDSGRRVRSSDLRGAAFTPRVCWARPRRFASVTPRRWLSTRRTSTMLHLDALRARLGDQAFAAEWASVQAFTLEQAVALALR